MTVSQVNRKLLFTLATRCFFLFFFLKYSQVWNADIGVAKIFNAIVFFFILSNGKWRGEDWKVEEIAVKGQVSIINSIGLQYIPMLIPVFWFTHSHIFPAQAVM